MLVSMSCSSITWSHLGNAGTSTASAARSSRPRAFVRRGRKCASRSIASDSARREREAEARFAALRDLPMRGSNASVRPIDSRRFPGTPVRLLASETVPRMRSGTGRRLGDCCVTSRGTARPATTIGSCGCGGRCRDQARMRVSVARRARNGRAMVPVRQGRRIPEMVREPSSTSLTGSDDGREIQRLIGLDRSHPIPPLQPGLHLRARRSRGRTF